MADHCIECGKRLGDREGYRITKDGKLTEDRCCDDCAETRLPLSVAGGGLSSALSGALDPPAPESFGMGLFYLVLAAAVLVSTIGISFALLTRYI